MPTKVFKSPGVFASEIDESQPTSETIQGVPAGVIGTSETGPAFVPVTVGNLASFKAVFGDVRTTTNINFYGAMAAGEYLRNATALTYLRVMGVGDGKKNLTSDDTSVSDPENRVLAGGVKDAGFIVGERQPVDNGNLGDNTYATSNGDKGRTYFLGCWLSDSVGSSLLRDQGQYDFFWEDPPGETTNEMTCSIPIIRGVLMAASGVIPRLSSTLPNWSLKALAVDAHNFGQGNSPTPTLTGSTLTLAGDVNPQIAGKMSGTVQLADGGASFQLILNGFQGEDATDFDDKILSCSFNDKDANYFPKVLNTVPKDFQKTGHLLYTWYDIPTAYAAVTGSGIMRIEATNYNGASGSHENIAFLMTGALARNAGSTTVPNYEGFTDRYKHAKSPWFVSQKFGGIHHKLFKVHQLDDGANSNPIAKLYGYSDKYKISITALNKAAKTFSLQLRRFEDLDSVKPLQQYRNLSLDPNNARFVGKIIGDTYVYYDFDQAENSQKIVVEGNYPNTSRFIRLELAEGLLNGEVPITALPFGFTSIDHLYTSGALSWNEDWSTLHSASDGDAHQAGAYKGTTIVDMLKSARIPGIPFRENLRTVKLSDANDSNFDLNYYWGVQVHRKAKVEQPNAATATGDQNYTAIDATVRSYTKYFPNFASANKNVLVEDTAESTSTAFGKNYFTLENIQVPTGSDGKADHKNVYLWKYVRDGNVSTNGSKSFDLDDLDLASNVKFAKYTTIMQGGFNGVNVFDTNMRDLTNATIKHEMDNASTRGGKNGRTVSAYKKALDVIGNTADVDIKLLAIPGIRHAVVTDDAINTVEDRFDAMLILDVEERDDMDTVVTGSKQKPNVSVKNTVKSFRNRALDTNFAAAYFPDISLNVSVFDQKLKKSVSTIIDYVPPTVAVLGAYARNDLLGHPWFAPAGTNRGQLEKATDVNVKMNDKNRDDLASVDINAIVQQAGDEVPIIFGQNTLQTANTSLDRVNVRRLLIEIRREVKRIANRLLFEPNRASTLARFSSLVNPILADIQANAGVDRFKVIIDTTTTTQADVENNTIRGKIFIQPTRTAEFISLDFVVTNTIQE